MSKTLHLRFEFSRETFDTRLLVDCGNLGAFVDEVATEALADSARGAGDGDHLTFECCAVCRSCHPFNAPSRPPIRPTSLVDLIYALKAGYRQNGSFVMNRKTQAAVRKFKDTTGGYLWQPPAAAGAPR